MQVLVVSDSHGDIQTLRRILKAETQADAVFHLGDGAAEFASLLPELGGISAFGHKGNCDASACGFPLESVSNVGGVRIFACHGHTKHVKSSLLEAMLAAIEQNAAVCLYGHTHVPDISRHNGVWLICPGAVINGRYAVMDLGGDGSIYPALKMI